jgi:hypothetical protein
MNSIQVYISLFLWLSISMAGPKVEFPEGRVHDFGEVRVNTSTKHRFKLINSGDAALKILNVSTTCGCTIAEYSKSIAPSDTGFVDVVYTAASSPQVFKKYIMVMNNSEDQVEKLTIFGKVVN